MAVTIEVPPVSCVWHPEPVSFRCSWRCWLIFSVKERGNCKSSQLLFGAWEAGSILLGNGKAWAGTFLWVFYFSWKANCTWLLWACSYPFVGMLHSAIIPLVAETTRGMMMTLAHIYHCDFNCSQQPRQTPWQWITFCSREGKEGRSWTAR